MVTLAETIGHRPSMEDDHCIIESINKEYNLQQEINQAFFGIFDGRKTHLRNTSN